MAGKKKPTEVRAKRAKTPKVPKATNGATVGYEAQLWAMADALRAAMTDARLGTLAGVGVDEIGVSDWGRPQSANVIAELDAGLNLILELLVFLENQFAAGALDRVTIARTCGVLDETMRNWENALKRSSSSLSF